MIVECSYRVLMEPEIKHQSHVLASVKGKLREIGFPTGITQEQRGDLQNKSARTESLVSESKQ